MQAQELARKLKRGEAPIVLDVRSHFEFEKGHIPGAVHIPFWSVLLYLGRLPDSKEASLVLTCEHGPRARLAGFQLKIAGYRHIQMLQGHMAGWRRSGLPTVWDD